MYRAVNPNPLLNNEVRKNQVSVNVLHRSPTLHNGSSNQSATNEEEMEDDMAALRSQSGWFQYLQVCINLLFAFQELPYTLGLDVETLRYTIRTSRMRKTICFGFHLCGAIVFWTEFSKLIKEIRHFHDDYHYFDLLNLLGWLTFDYPMMHLWFFKTHLVQEFFDELQDSPLLKISSPRSLYRGIAWGAWILWYILTTFCLFPTRWGILDWSFANYHATLKAACELHFGVSQSWEWASWYPLMLFITFIFTSFQYGSVLCKDMLSASCVFTMLIIGRDLDKAIRDGHLCEEEVLMLLSAHKRLTRKLNRSFGFMVSVYVVYAASYYALHFVDLVETPGLLNQISLLTYAVTLYLVCKWATDIIIIAKRRKRWLSARRGSLLMLDRSSYAIFLDDYTWEKYGLGAYYTVNGYVVGQVFSLIITVAIVRIQGLAKSRISESS